MKNNTHKENNKINHQVRYALFSLSTLNYVASTALLRPVVFA